MERNNNGFTLVELVVVISILGVLIAILAPGYTSKIHKAKVATDWANVKSYYNEIQTDYMFTDKYNPTFANWKSVSLFACSLGAYFSLQAYKDITFEKCFFLSPIVNMEYLIKNMFQWFHVTEEMLYTKREIPTLIDTLSWDYFQYVKKNPVTRWNSPTYILYGGKDNLQSLQVIENFTKSNSVLLTISEQSEHSFMGKGDDRIIKSWICDNL